MGKHNGKSRNTGMRIGASLISASKQNQKAHQNEEAGLRHTTNTNMQSVVAENSLSDLMRMADLAGRDFEGERGGGAVIISAAQVVGSQLSEEERAAILDKHADAMNIPRRPAWNRQTTAQQIQEQERAAFLEWRRRLARLEEHEGVVLTPFEKNLEVWRQLWRVIERSDVIVQVVDARDPLFYRSSDLESYARQVRPHAKCILLMNKADLLPDEVRHIWADYFNEQGIRFVFWSAFMSAERQKEQSKADVSLAEPEATAAATPPSTEVESQIKILDETELVEFLSREAAAIMAASRDSETAQDHAQAADTPSEGNTDEGSGGPKSSHPAEVPTVGLIGFPNVGKSSTINALYGSKKTAVAATPGKTKHFQTLFVTPQLRLCDCPGLVLPRLASSIADMVAAGVLPIDRLTDVKAAVAAVAARVSRQQLFSTLKVRMTKPKAHENLDPAECGTAIDLLSAYAANRSWVNGSGLPDTSTAARAVLKDYTSGKLVYCEWPPGKARKCPWDDGLGTWTSHEDLLQFSAGEVLKKQVVAALQAKPSRATQAQSKLTPHEIKDMKAMNVVDEGQEKVSRAKHKFQKKPQKHAKVPGRVLAKAGVSPYGNCDVEV